MSTKTKEKISKCKGTRGEDSSSDSDSDGNVQPDSTTASDSKPKFGRAERKARKMIGRLNLTQVTGINTVSIRKSKHLMFIIEKPEVYKSSCNDTYIIFGEPRFKNTFEDAQEEAARRFKKGCVITEVPTSNNLPMILPAVEERNEEEVDEDGVDEDGVNHHDIELVMVQANVSRAKAIQALKNNRNDIVDAIMELTG